MAPHLNYQSMMVVDQMGPDETIDMDASGQGIGAVNHISKEFFLLALPPPVNEMPIHCGEMAAVMLSVDVWSGQRANPLTPGIGKSVFSSKNVTLLSDNQAVIHAINSGRATDDFLGKGMRFIHYQMALVDGHFSLRYINTKDNTWADGLSRRNQDTFQKLI